MKFFDRDGKPITRDEWGKLCGDDDYRRVAIVDLGERLISTVWMGIDHNFGKGKPIIFETMVFGDAFVADDYCERYSTLEEAEAGHARIVSQVRSDLNG